MFAENKRKTIVQSSSTLFVTYLVDIIIKFITSGRSCRPHQLQIRFINIYGQLSEERAEINSQLDVQVQVWVDIPPKIGVEFFLRFKIHRRPENAAWALSNRPILITSHAQHTFNINCSEDLQNYNAVTQSDGQALVATREWLGIEKR